MFFLLLMRLWITIVILVLLGNFHKLKRKKKKKFHYRSVIFVIDWLTIMWRKLCCMVCRIRILLRYPSKRSYLIWLGFHQFGRYRPTIKLINIQSFLTFFEISAANMNRVCILFLDHHNSYRTLAKVEWY